MAKYETPRFFVTRRNADGTERHYWQPPSYVRALGFKNQELGHDLQPALDAAKVWNQRLDQARGKAVADAAAPAELFADQRRRRRPRDQQRGYIIPGSVPHLISLLKATDRWRRLADDTRKGYEFDFRLIEAWACDDPIKSFTKKDGKIFYADQSKRSVSVANRLMAVLRMLWNFAIDEELTGANPFLRPRLIEHERAEVSIWLDTLVMAFARAADAKGRHSIATSVIVNHWIGQRPRDVLRLRPDLYRDGTFKLRQSKTKAEVIVPHSPLVAARVEEELRRQAKRWPDMKFTTLIVNEETGQPWHKDTFRHNFNEIRDLAVTGSNVLGLPPCPELKGMRFAWLRHTAVTMLAIAGCTIPEIAAITGHSLKTVTKILDTYLIRVAALAQGATAKRLAHGGIHNLLTIDASAASRSGADNNPTKAKDTA